MARYNQVDIVAELIDLSRDLIGDIRQQLTYYRASVYKHETARHIKSRIERLRVVADVVGDPILCDAFNDYDAMADAGVNVCLPGECSFSTRSANLTSAVESHLEVLENKISNREKVAGYGLLRKVKDRRREILSACRQGSRPWAFFQAFHL